MQLWLFLGIIAIGTGGILILGWRFLSRRDPLPCPAAFIWMLENRIMDNVAGSEALIQRALVYPGMDVLDAGCGAGRVSIPLAKFVGPEGKVTAVDIQAKMLHRLAERSHQAGLGNIEIIHAGVGDGKLPTSRFDRAFLVTVLGEITDQVKALREIFQALRPGGILSITEVLPDPHYQSRQKVRSMGEALGYDIAPAYTGLRAYTLNLIKPQGVADHRVLASDKPIKHNVDQRHVSRDEGGS